jgi:hypothetical protein
MDSEPGTYAPSRDLPHPHSLKRANNLGLLPQGNGLCIYGPLMWNHFATIWLKGRTGGTTAMAFRWAARQRTVPGGPSCFAGPYDTRSRLGSTIFRGDERVSGSKFPLRLRFQLRLVLPGSRPVRF